jgi:hypothetical protein
MTLKSFEGLQKTPSMMIDDAASRLLAKAMALTVSRPLPQIQRFLADTCSRFPEPLRTGILQHPKTRAALWVVS